MLTVVVTAVSSTAIEVYWNFDTSDGTSLPDSIGVHEFDQYGNQLDHNSNGVSPLAGPMLFSGLAPSTTYYYQFCTVSQGYVTCGAWNKYQGTTKVVTPPPPPSPGWKIHRINAAGGTPTAAGWLSGYVWVNQQTQHVVYVGQDRNLHQLDSNGSWGVSNFYGISGVAPVGYMWERQGSEHIAYVGPGNGIWELYYSGNQWANHELTAAVNGAPHSLGGGLPAAFVWENQNTEHIFYVGTDSHIHELYYDTQWHLNDITKSVGGNPPSPVGDLAGFAFENQNTEHVFYTGSDGGIHEFYYDGRWHHNDLLVSAGAAGLKGIVSMAAAYVWENQNTEHVICGNAAERSLFELYYSGGRWQISNLLASTGAPGYTSGVAAYVWENQGTEHVVYVGTDGHLHELYYDQAWHHNDLTDAVGGTPPPAADRAGFICGYAMESSQHVFYVGSDGSIYELYFS